MIERRQNQRVMLITPPYHCGMVESAGVWMPLGLAYLAGSLRAAGFDPIIYDAMSLFHNLDQIRATLADVQPDVVGLTAYTATVGAALDVAHAAKEVAPRALTVMGGIHPSFMAAQVLADPAVDYVVRGEGEHTFAELLACLNALDEPAAVPGVSYRLDDGHVASTPCRPFLRDLDALPVAWDLLDWPTYYYRTKPGSRLAIVSWARGCTESCTFCSQQKFWRRTWRPRSVESIIAELRLLREVYGVDTVEVADEYPTRDPERWTRILDRLIEEDLGIELLMETRADDVVRDAPLLERYRDAGILHVYVGVESVRQDRLDSMRKNLDVDQSRLALRLLNDTGIITETSFLLGFPDETRESVEKTLELSLEYDPDLAFFLAITPWPYSAYWDEVKDSVEVFDYSRYNLCNPVLRPGEMTRDELSGLLSHCFQTFYMAKMRRLGSMSPNKRLYLMSVAKLLMENSYLAGEVKVSMESLGMPHHALVPPHHAPSPGNHMPGTPHHAPVMGHHGRGPSPHVERELEVVAR
jgi:anaerobic magnesium-protoporphyrin IX monomethyl ester cyclase